MGKVIVKAKIKNYVDEELVKLGFLKPDQIRKVEIDALVDTGATMLVLPQDVVDKLGLTKIREVTAKYANNTKEKKYVVGVANVEIVGRNSNFNAVVEPAFSTPLIGQIILEELDLVVNPKTNTLMPNPESPDIPLIDLL
ncbi:MAG TPA: clan AA aspartic protease [Methanosarcinales archaeon]|nr:clan AA aspartic protease [Methanosarcinales archaeon]